MPDNNTQIEMLRREVESLKAELYRGNFTGSQDFNKKVRLNTAVRLPVYGVAPSKCEQGEMYVNTNGKAYVCSATNTWTIVGVQTA